MLNIHELNVFVEAAQVENFSMAAERLSLSQPAVSLQIRNLENELGVELFRRNGRNVVLSEAGRMLLPLAQDLLRQSKHVEELMWGLQGMVIGELSIACSTTAGKYVLPRLVAGFRRKYAEVNVSVNAVNRHAAADWVLEGRAEVGLVSCELAHRDLEYRPFLEDPVVLVVPPDHPWADGRTVEPDDLVQLPLIAREPAAGTSDVLVKGLAQHGLSVSDLQVVMTLGSAEAVAMSVEAGIAAAFIPRLVAARSLGLGCVALVPVRGMPLNRTIYLVRHLRRAPTPPQQAFWDFAFDAQPQLIGESPQP